MSATNDNRLSGRLQSAVDALPLQQGMRVLEIGCGPGAMARELAQRVGEGFVLGIDRSAKAIDQAVKASQEQIKAKTLDFRRVAVEDFVLAADERPFDLAVALRVGALDGRHPQLERDAFQRIARALRSRGRLYIDGGDPLREVDLSPYRG